jgi:hypothetical protein
MDINCPKCGEPWNADELHYVAKENQTTFSEELAKFSRTGCEVFGEQHADPADQQRALAASVAFKLMGDDVDGIAAFMEDLGDY